MARPLTVSMTSFETQTRKMRPSITGNVLAGQTDGGFRTSSTTSLKKMSSQMKSVNECEKTRRSRDPTGAVCPTWVWPLMLDWMNAQALRLTLDTGEAHYFSRSRQALWKKGETSGQIQQVVEVRIDCDQDAVLLKVRPQGDGGACHVGFRSCFYRVVENGSLIERPD